MPASGSGPLSLFDEEFLLAVDEASGFEPLAELPVAVSAATLVPPPPGYAEAVPPAPSEPIRTWTELDEPSPIAGKSTAPRSDEPAPPRASEALERLRKRRTTRRLVAPTAVLGNPPVRRLVEADSQPLPIALPHLEVAAADDTDEPTLEVDLETLVRQSNPARVPLRFLRGARVLGAAPIEEALSRTERDLGLPPRSWTKGKASHQTLRGAESPLTAEQRATLAGVFDGLEEQPHAPADTATAAADDEDWPDWPLTPRGDEASAAVPQPPAYVSPLEALEPPSRPRDRATAGHSAAGEGTRSAAPLGNAPPRHAPRLSVARTMPAAVIGADGDAQETRARGPVDADADRSPGRRNSVPRFVSALFHLGGPTPGAPLVEGEGFGRPRGKRAPWVVGSVAAAALLLMGVVGMSNRETSSASASSVAAASIPVLPAAEPSPMANPVAAHEHAPPTVTPHEPATPPTPRLSSPASVAGDTSLAVQAPAERQRTPSLRRRARTTMPTPAPIPEEETVPVVEEAPEPEPVLAAPTIPEVERKTAASLFAEATSAFEREDYESAFRLAMESRGMQGRGEVEVLRLIARSGCRIGRRDHARDAVRELPFLKRSSVRRECRREGERLGW